MTNQVLYKLSLGFVLGLITAAPLIAQPAFTRSTFFANYDAISPSSGATLSTATGDNGIQSAIPIGFTFNYLGTNYTTIGVSTNGVASFSGITNSANNIDLYTTAAPNSVLAPWWDDLATGSGAIFYQTLGAPGSRKFTVQWTNVRSYSTGSTAELNFQLVLHETTNVIEFCYGSAATSGFNTAQESACIGIKTATGGSGEFIDAVTGSSYTGNAMLAAWRTWPARFFRFTPGFPAPLSGTFNVGSGETYESLSDAIADVNHRGVSGPVSFALADTNFDEVHGANFFPILVGPISGTSIISGVEIHSYLPLAGRATISSKGGLAGTCVTPGSLAAITAANEPVIAYVGVHYMGINHVNIVASTPEVDRGIEVINSSAVNGTQNSGVSDVLIRLFRSNMNSIGIEQRTVVAPANGAGANSRNAYNGFRILNCYSGISISGDAVIPDSSTTIQAMTSYQFNQIGDTVADDIGNGTADVYGIRATNQFNIFISNTIIRNLTAQGNANATGISATNCYGPCTIFSNKISEIKNAGASSTGVVCGIEVANAASGSGLLSVNNNFVAHLEDSYSGSPSAVVLVKGIYIASPAGNPSGTVSVDFNSVSLDQPNTNSSSACFETSTATGPVVLLRNNILSNKTGAQSSPAGHYCIVTPATTAIGSAGSLSDHNDLFLQNASGGAFVHGNTTTYNSLPDWQNAAAFDSHSLSVDPLFNGWYDLHVNQVLLNGAGIFIPGIANDIDYQVRDSVPDIGAEEFGIIIDPGVSALVSPPDNSCPGTDVPVTVRVKNYSQAAIDFNIDPLFVYTDVTGSTTFSLLTTLHDNSLNGNVPLPTGASIDIPLGNMAVAPESVYHFTLYLYAQHDTDALNDTLRTTIYSDTLPVASFSYTQSSSTVFFTNTSAGASSYLWDFGDNQNSVQEDPSHVYTQSGLYTVTLTATDQCGSDTMQAHLPWISTAVEEPYLTAVHVFPNPASTTLTVYIGNSANDLTVQLYDVHGALVREQPVGSVIAGTDISLDISSLDPGDYLLRIRSAGSECYTKVVVQR